MIILIVAILAIIAIMLIVAGMKPNHFQVSRSISIHATPENIAPLIEDFHLWELWSPFEKLDPQMNKIYSGADRGVGAKYRWEGSGRAGIGEMEVTESVPGSKIVIKLDFLKPFEAHNVSEFAMQQDGDSTKVTWSMKGPRPFIAKVMHTLMNMEKMIGGEFQTGLESMKRLAEK